MSVKVRPFKRRGAVLPGRWEAYFVVKRANDEVIRRKEVIPEDFKSKTAANEWAQQRFAHLFNHGTKSANDTERAPVQTLSEFAPKFMEWARTERQKPSTIESKQAILDFHLIPLLGEKPLDQLTTKDVQAVKTRLMSRSVKTSNNVLAVLSKLLKVAVELEVIPVLPCTVKGKKTDSGEMEFYEFEQYDALVEAAAKLGARTLITMLLGGDAGLRTGEMLALEWTDIDFRRGLITVARSEWKGQVTLPKGGKRRTVPMTARLKAALEAFRTNQLRGERVLFRDDGTPMSEQTLRSWAASAQRRANLKANGGKHILRHTFCSHLAMGGATAIAIKELAGHRDLSTTMRYMHLSPNHKDEAIRLLDRGREAALYPSDTPVSRGEKMATGRFSVVTA